MSRPNCRRAKKFLISRFGSDFGLVWAGESVGESVGLIQEKELDSVGMGRNGPEWAGMGRNGPEWAGMGRNGPEWAGMGRNGPEFGLHTDVQFDMSSWRDSFEHPSCAAACSPHVDQTKSAQEAKIILHRAFWYL